MSEAVIVDAIRTPIGRAHKGSLEKHAGRRPRCHPAPRAGSSATRRSTSSETEDLIMGCALQLGEQGYNVGRSAQLLAGIDHHVPAT